MTKEHIISKEEHDKLMEMYYDNVKSDEMYKLTKIPKRKIAKFFKDKNLSLVKRYSIREDYFESIDSKEKAYWLGYLYCDGFVGSGKYNNIVLSSIDEFVINSFISQIVISGHKFVKKLSLVENRVNSYAVNDLHESRFSSKIMKEDLYRYNIFTNRKTTHFINYDNVDNELYKYILYGILDADGHVSFKNNRHICHLYVSKELLNQYEDFIDLMDLKYSIKHHKDKDCYYIRFLLSDEKTLKLINKYHEYSKISRKSNAPSLSKDSVE